MPKAPQALAGEDACDVVELRLDLLPRRLRWLAYARAIEAAGRPVILTLRLRTEGGKWARPDAERLPYLKAGLENLAAVDVEIRSSIAPVVATLAQRQGKVCILSFHDFERTPSLEVLRAIVKEAQEMASVVKITTLVHGAADLLTLRKLLKGRWKVPLCVMGMGPRGARARASLAAMGSCLTYGFLDREVAPGQMAAASLVRQLSRRLPEYRSARG